MQHSRIAAVPLTSRVEPTELVSQIVPITEGRGLKKKKNADEDLKLTSDQSKNVQQPETNCFKKDIIYYYTVWG